MAKAGLKGLLPNPSLKAGVSEITTGKGLQPIICYLFFRSKLIYE
jgi:hypothetical protein